MTVLPRCCLISLAWCFLSSFRGNILAVQSFSLNVPASSIGPTVMTYYRSTTSNRGKVSPCLHAMHEDDTDHSKSNNVIPQLPAASCDTSSASSTDATTTASTTPPAPFVASRKFQLQYTCNVCETRNTHLVSRIAYRNGVVIATCKGCDSQHLIADNLGWTDYDGGFQGSTNTIEDYYEDGTVHRVSQDVFALESILKSHNTDSGSIVGDDGKLAME